MGMRFFSECRASDNKLGAGDPDPSLFSVKNVLHIGDFTLAVINYPGCTTYGGDKIAVYTGWISKESLSAMKFLDPHFIESGLSPIARFPGNDHGLNAAKLFCRAASGL
jgi:hypothetical protein